MNKIELKYVDRGIVRGGLLFLNFETAMKMVKECRATDLTILGIDAFILDHGKTQPVIEHSIDMSNLVSRSENCWETAEKFLLDKRSKEYFFEIVTA